MTSAPRPLRPENVYPLDASHVDEATALLARAFFDYPVWSWVLPDDSHRREVLPLAMRASVRWGLILEAMYGVGRPPLGVAIWAPPGMADADVDPDGSRTGWNLFASAAGKRALQRFESMIEIQQPLRAELIPPGGWYLPWLGVEPAVQRSGAGSALLRAMWSRLDPHGAATYLETEKAANVPYYVARGYELLRQGELPDGGPAYFCLRRTPAARPGVPGT